MHFRDEEFIIYIWKFQLFEKNKLTTKSGKELQILKQGTRQFNSGPDFRDAIIIIDNIKLFGNVEIHIHSSDWEKHGHHKDKAYDSTILHVVWESSQLATYLNNGQQVEILELKNKVSEELAAKYHLLSLYKKPIACVEFEHQLSEVNLYAFTEKLAIERLKRKIDNIESLLTQTKNNWDQVLFILLSRYLGTSLNNDAMQLLANSIDINILKRNIQDIKIVESLLFGQAGMLEIDNDNNYFKDLKKEYNYQKRLHQLNPLQAHTFKFSKIRPSAFPTFRIAQLSRLIVNKVLDIDYISQLSNLSDYEKLFKIESSSFWEFHYNFEQKQSNKHSLKLGKTSIDILIINYIAPILFAYGKYRNQEELCDKSLEILESIKPENNSIIRCFEAIKLKPVNALESQAFIQLKSEYCDKFRCLECAIGHNILRKTI
jgi:hypothetical protein